MNQVDLVILGTAALAGLLGLRSGLLAPASGVGGLILGVALALTHHGKLAVTFEELIDHEAGRTIVAFGAIVIITVIAARVGASMLKRLFAYLYLGWVDHLAGALAGVLVATVVLGTGVDLLHGADVPQANGPLRESELAAWVSQASVVASATPWCSALNRDGAPGECRDLELLARQAFGSGPVDMLSNLLGQDVGNLTEVVTIGLKGSPEELRNLASDNE